MAILRFDQRISDAQMGCRSCSQPMLFSKMLNAKARDVSRISEAIEI